jgi:hypothetical protein
MRRKIWCDGWKRKYFELGWEVNKAYVVRFANIVRIFEISYILYSCLPNDASYHEEDDFFQNNPHKSL